VSAYDLAPPILALFNRYEYLNEAADFTVDDKRHMVELFRNPRGPCVFTCKLSPLFSDILAEEVEAVRLARTTPGMFCGATAEYPALVARMEELRATLDDFTGSATKVPAAVSYPHPSTHTRPSLDPHPILTLPSLDPHLTLT
jgi:hypothetical protein